MARCWLAIASCVIAVRVAAMRRSTSTTQRSKRPHLIHVLVDDWGYNDIGFRDKYLATPRMDSLAQSGVIVEHFYATPVCTPSRGALMTGRMPWRWGMADFKPNLDHPYVVNSGEVFLAEELAKSGQYRSAMVGKWDLGAATKSELPFSKGFGEFTLLGKPTQHWGGGCNQYNFAFSNVDVVREEGFKGYFLSSYGLPARNHTVDGLWDIHDGVPCQADGHGCDHQRKAFCSAFGAEYDSTSEWVAPETPLSIQKPGTYTTDVWSDLAVEFIEKHAAMNDDRGLYLYVAFTSVHAPVQAHHDDVYGTRCANYPEAGKTPQFTEETAEAGNTKAAAAYPFKQCAEGFPGPCANDGNFKRKVQCGAIHAVDRAVGKIVDALRSASMWDDTVLMVMGDNGGANDDASLNFPYYGGKNTGWEGGLKVPAFWSGGFLEQSLVASQQSPHTSSNLNLLVDVHATFASLAQIEPEKKKQSENDYDGVDQWEGLISPSSKPPRTTAVVVSGTRRLGSMKVAIAHGDDGRRWKLLHNPSGWSLFGPTVMLTECAKKLNGCDGLLKCVNDLGKQMGIFPDGDGGSSPLEAIEKIPDFFRHFIVWMTGGTKFCNSLRRMRTTYDRLLVDGSKQAFDLANNATLGMLDAFGDIVQRRLDEWFLFDLDACVDEGGDECNPRKGGDANCDCNLHNYHEKWRPDKAKAQTTKKVQLQLQQALELAEQASTPSRYSPLGDPWGAFDQFDWFVNPWRDSNHDATLCTIRDPRSGEPSTWNTPRCASKFRDVTHLFISNTSANMKYAELADGHTYKCCCNEETGVCKLENADEEKSSWLFRGCGSLIGRKWHSWHKMKDYVSAVDGLPGVGSCVVSEHQLPNVLRASLAA